MFSNRLTYLFILIFLIICFVVYLWVEQQRRKKEEKKPKRPIFRLPRKKEGFTSALDVYAGSKCAPGSGSGSKSGSTIPGCGKYPSQFDNPEDSYGKWEVTWADKYYDTYEENELIAISNAVAQLKDLTPKPQVIPDYGSTLGSFDSETTKIPWDADNSSYNKSDIVWGEVSEQASRSIYMKTWLQTLVNNIENMNPCGQNNSSYCYQSPLFPVSVTDPKQGIALQVSEATTQALGQAMQMVLINSITGGAEGKTFEQVERGPDGKPLLDEKGKVKTENIKNTFQNRLNANKNTLGRLTGTRSNFPLERVPTQNTQLGSQLNASGLAKVNHALKTIKTKLKSLLMGVNTKTRVAATTNGSAMVAAANTAAAAANSQAAAATAAAVATAGAATPAAIALSALAVVATTIATFVTWFFGTFQLILMYVDTLLIPIVDSLLHPGGVCPSGSRRLSTLIPSYAMTIIANFIPMGAYLQQFDPFICWSPDGGIHLMTPPRVPPFMSNEALSLRYHSKWVAGNRPNSPKVQNLSVILDPLPPGYVWLSQSDLKNSPNVNSITAYAKQYAELHSHTVKDAVKTGGSVNGIPDYIAIEVCSKGTIPSPDGMKCVSQQIRTSTREPSFTGCLATEYDDGFNCWTTKSGNCTGGAVTITSGTTWSDTNGYMSYSVTPLVCDGVTVATGTVGNSGITKWYNQRVTCDTGYEKDVGGLLCYAKCPSGFKRIGAICQSTTATYDRAYRFATHSLYYDQPYTPETLLSLADVKIPYCDFSSPTMLDRMGQFYYNQSLNNPQKNEDGTITVQMIVGFLGVTSSSELSCDVACYINFITYNPISGEKYSSVLGCSSEYTDDTTGFKGINYCYRRFYFILGPNDTQGLFTVTGCTFAPYTAPDAMVFSADYVNGSNLIASLPRVWQEINKTASIVDVQNLVKNIENGKIATQAGKGIVNTTFMLGAGQIGGKLGGVGGGIVAGVGASLFTSMYSDKQIDRALGCAIHTGDVTNAVDTFITGSSRNNLTVVTNNNWWTINQGPIYELASGYTPTIDFCQKVIVGGDYCSYKYVVRDVVNRYHLENPARHVQQVTEIEPRGKNGCYYKFKEVSYDPLTNIEGVIQMDKEIIMENKIKDYATCTYGPLAFTTKLEDFPIRTYIDPATYELPVQKTLYPTRQTVYKSDLMARFVRVRPPLVPATGGSLQGDGFLNLSQIAVFDISGFNVSRLQPTYATSTSSLSATADAVVNGTSDDASTLAAVWQPATNGITEYWEVDLSNNITIAEIVYFGATIQAGRNQGVRIEFLYSNGVNDIPIHTITLPNDDSTQFIPLHSSMYTKPMLPVAGPIKIPRPIVQGVTLGVEYGCVNRCENKAIIDSVIEQYNSQMQDRQIVKILRGITPNTNTCEYLAEFLVQDVPTTNSEGSSVTGKRSMVKQYISMTLSPTITKYTGLVFARYVVIKPSFTTGTVLEVSKILVWNSVPVEGRQEKKPGSNVAQGMGYEGNITSYNQLYLQAQMRPNPIQNITDGTTKPTLYPNTYTARSNDPNTFLQIDLVPPASSACSGNNYEIFQIQFVGRADRAAGGIKGIQIELYGDVPDDQENATTGKYAPVFRYVLPTDDTNQMITVGPPAQCSFTLQSADVLQEPAFLQPNVPDFSTIDTSGGVFFFSGMLNTIKGAWSSLQSLTSQDINSPVTENVKKSGEIVNSMLETVAAGQTIIGTNNTCRDPAVLKGFMTSYALSRGPSINDQFAVSTYTMNRILKAGQSSPNTCDVLFEEIYANYDDYIVDVKDPSNKGTTIKAARFIMNALNGNAIPAQDEPNSETQKNVLDLDSNALGLLTNISTLSPVFTGPGYMANCRDPAIIRSIKTQLEGKPVTTTTKTTTASYTQLMQTFQSTPLSCEYKILKNITEVNRINKSTYKSKDLDTWVKAIFTLGSDNRTPTLDKVIEYDPATITISSDQLHSCFGPCITSNGKIQNEAFLPSLFSYDPVKYPAKYPSSTRINTTVIPLV